MMDMPWRASFWGHYNFKTPGFAITALGVDFVWAGRSGVRCNSEGLKDGATAEN
jgi:hypothetical protein